MLKQRTDLSNNSTTFKDNNLGSNFSNAVTTNIIENPNSAKATAISSPSERDLRVPCYCEENVWRLAYRRIYGPPTPPTTVLPASFVSTSTTSSISYNTTTNSTMNIDKENEQYYVVFVSNDERCCPMLNQRASKYPNEPCFWDYHVILIHCSKQQNNPKMATIHNNNNSFNSSTINNTQVLDMDSRLSYPCTLHEYLNGTFKIDFTDNKAKKKYAPKFRVIRAEMFLKNFYSDRMHMFHNGKWSSPPPSYDCILTDLPLMKLCKNGSMSNLNEYISMSGGGEGGGGGGKRKESSAMGEVLTLAELKSKFGG